jgi:rubrerythrin
MELKGSKTLENLQKAFAGESQARVKYEYYSSRAKKDGFEQIAAIFDETSHNEKEHAKIWFKLLHDGGILDTESNLKDAAAGENYEWTDMYKAFAETAREEGFEDIANKFEMVLKIEREHEDRYNTVLQNIQEDNVFKKPTEQVWICRNCGHIHIGTEALGMCPVCEHPQAFEEVRSLTWQ